MQQFLSRLLLVRGFLLELTNDLVESTCLKGFGGGGFGCDRISSSCCHSAGYEQEAKENQNRYASGKADTSECGFIKQL